MMKKKQAACLSDGRCGLFFCFLVAGSRRVDGVSCAEQGVSNTPPGIRLLPRQMHCQPGWEWLRYPAARAGPLFYVTDYIQQGVFHRQRAGKRSVFIADSYKNSCIENRRRIYDC